MPALDYAQVAALYDTYVQTDFDHAFFLAEAAKVSGEVLELTSGTGRVSIPLLEAGVRLTCVDQSPEMLDLLRRKLAARGLAAPVHEMDVCDLDLPQQFELIFIPYHAFAEFLTPADQHQALVKIQRHLTASGRFICTLHNPPLRLRSVDGRLKLWGRFDVGDGQGSLFVWGLENQHPDQRTVVGYQFFEIYGPDNVLQSKSFVDLRFCLHERDAFEAMAEAAGFRVEALYGDYSYGTFDEQESAVMVWVLRKQPADDRG